MFFESIEYAIHNGVKAEEVSYQEKFARATLKNLIAAYPGKDVKRGLESLYAKVLKHLGKDDSLLQVIWRNMQEEFLRQLQHYEALIARCYPNTRTTLDFTIDDVLRYFSEIAQQQTNAGARF